MFEIRMIRCATCLSALLLSGGCALRHGDFALDGTLRIALLPATGPLFYGVQVAQHGDELMVSGFGRRPEPRGHVEIVVLGPDGISLARAVVDPMPPAAVPNRSYNYRFKAALPLISPAGSTLRVTYGDFSPTDSQGSGDRRRTGGKSAPAPIAGGRLAKLPAGG